MQAAEEIAQWYWPSVPRGLSRSDMTAHIQTIFERTKGKHMARRNNLNDDDLTVIQQSIDDSITTIHNESTPRPSDGNIASDIARLAPLFRVREKVVAMKSKTDGKAARATRAPRTTTTRPTITAD